MLVKRKQVSRKQNQSEGKLQRGRWTLSSYAWIEKKQLNVLCVMTRYVLNTCSLNTPNINPELGGDDAIDATRRSGKEVARLYKSIELSIVS